MFKLNKNTIKLKMFSNALSENYELNDFEMQNDGIYLYTICFY